jgi:hypothetical protein
MENSVHRVHGAVDRRRRRSTVDRGHRLRGGSLENGLNGTPVRETSPRLRKKGEGMAMSLADCKRGGGGTDMAGRRWGTTGGGGAQWGGRCGLGREQMRAG